MQSSQPFDVNIIPPFTDIVLGRRPLSDFEQLVKDWQSNGGETIRKEYMDSIAASS